MISRKHTGSFIFYENVAVFLIKKSIYTDFQWTYELVKVFFSNVSAVDVLAVQSSLIKELYL